MNTAAVSFQPSSRARAAVRADAIPVAPVPALSDEELVARATVGDSWAEEAVYRRYAALILGTARRLLADSVEAQDVAQETFAAAFGAWGQLREPARLRRWLLQIAIRKVHRRFRRQRLLRALGFDDFAHDATLDKLAKPDCPAEARAELGLLSRALDTISPASRIAWMLRHVEGLSLDEAAQECSCSLATVKRRIAAAQEHIDRFSQGEVS